MSVEAAAKPKVVVVMPAYNAGRTLRMTYEALPKDTVNLVILVDDGSTDATLDVAQQLGLEIFIHNRNYGYGANQKTCYAEALRAGADIVVMVHPDYQYDPRLVPQIIAPILAGHADVVLGSRLKSGSALEQGMPWWKYVSNRFLTGLENRVFGLELSEYHTGYRAFRREVLETVNFGANADGFVFDQEIIAQIVAARRFRVAEIAVPTRYFPDASSASFLASTVYGLRILAVLFWYALHVRGLRRSRRLDSLRARYQRLPDAVRSDPAASGVLAAAGDSAPRRGPSPRRPTTVVTLVYVAIVLCMWGKFAFGSGLYAETAFPYMSETMSVGQGFIYPADPLRPHTNTFYQVSYLLGELVSPGSFVPYQLVYAALWVARGLLVFGILARLLPHATWLAYLAGALTLVHASDGALQWVGQLNQFGFVFWMLLALYMLVVALDSELRMRAMAVLLMLACQYMSLWSYESGLVIMLALPIGVVAARRPLTRSGLAICAVWYAIPVAYILMTVDRYLRSTGTTYQEGILRRDWSVGALAADYWFNMVASVSFWNWCESARVAVSPSVAAWLGVAAAAAFVVGGLLVASMATDAGGLGSARRAMVLTGVGVAWIAASFPAYLLLSSARSLWRTQLLSGPGAALVFVGVVTLIGILLGVLRAPRMVSLGLAAIVLYQGAVCAVQRGGLHEGYWRTHRQGVVALLRAVPAVAPETIIVMTGVPKGRGQDPFGHAYWFDLAVRLAYPGTQVSGIYFYTDGNPAPGNSLQVTDGRWQWDRISAAPLVRDASLGQTVVVRYSPDGAGTILETFPDALCSGPCASDVYAPRARIVATAPPARVMHRYGPI